MRSCYFEICGLGPNDFLISCCLSLHFVNWFKVLLLVKYSKCGRLLLIFFFLQLENYAKTEEAKVEELIKAVADSGAKVIVSGGAVGEMALHFCERYKYIKLLPIFPTLYFALSCFDLILSP